MKLKSLLYKLFFPIIGIGASIWFLIRVIPKPSRATYPCIRVAYPLASAFVVYLLGLAASAFAVGKIREYWKNSHYWAMTGFLTIALVAGFFAFQADQPPIYASTSYLDTANTPRGIPRGIFPGRVVWSRNPDATNENCGNNSFGDAYYLSKNTNMSVVNDMVTNSILSLTGKSSVKKAWDTLFVYFNMKKGKGSVGYQAGEKIFIKTNAVGASNTYTSLNDYTMARTSPQPVLAILRELINDCGIAQENITVGDPQNGCQQELFDIWYAEFPNVKYISRTGGTGRTLSAAGADTAIYYSDHGAVMRTGDPNWADMSKGTPVTGDKLYAVFEESDYLIYVAALKVHERAGMTLIGKINFGSHTRTNAMQLHMGLVNPDATLGGNKNSRFGFKKYRVLVDLLGHKKLGGNAMLFVVDGLWGGPGANVKPVKFQMPPFNNHWPSSVFMSQDPIALESVCYDILKAEFTSDRHAETYPQMEGVDDHLYQAADSSFWPAGVRYDPERDGTVLGSLGVHEHWNNATDQKYSRDLGTGTGIELLKLNTLTSVENDLSSSPPHGFVLEPNYPNPFNPSTTLRYNLAQPAHVDLSIYNAQGQCIQTLVDAYQSNGTYSVQWNGRVKGITAASGIYFARLNAEGKQGAQSQVQRMVLLK